jgi:hypothetical protein
LPAVAFALTTTLMVTVAGAPLRALTVHVTILFEKGHEPLVALALTIDSCGSI